MIRAPRLAAALALASVAFPASAAEPIHLHCKISQINGSINHVDVTADEANGKVTTFVRSTGYRQTLPAVFRPDDVLFSDRGFDWRISRVDLTIVMKFRSIDSERTGVCEIPAVPKRAF